MIQNAVAPYTSRVKQGLSCPRAAFDDLDFGSRLVTADGTYHFVKRVPARLNNSELVRFIMPAYINGTGRLGAITIKTYTSQNDAAVTLTGSSLSFQNLAGATLDIVDTITIDATTEDSTAAAGTVSIYWKDIQQTPKKIVTKDLIIDIAIPITNFAVTDILLNPVLEFLRNEW